MMVGTGFEPTGVGGSRRRFSWKKTKYKNSENAMERRENAIEGDRERTDFVEFTPEADRTTQNDGERLYSAVRMYGGGRRNLHSLELKMSVVEKIAQGQKIRDVAREMDLGEGLVSSWWLQRAEIEAKSDRELVKTLKGMREIEEDDDQHYYILKGSPKKKPAASPAKATARRTPSRSEDSDTFAPAPGCSSAPSKGKTPGQKRKREESWSSLSSLEFTTTEDAVIENNIELSDLNLENYLNESSGLWDTKIFLGDNEDNSKDKTLTPKRKKEKSKKRKKQGDRREKIDSTKSETVSWRCEVLTSRSSDSESSSASHTWQARIISGHPVESSRNQDNSRPVSRVEYLSSPSQPGFSSPDLDQTPRSAVVSPVNTPVTISTSPSSASQPVPTSSCSSSAFTGSSTLPNCATSTTANSSAFTTLNLSSNQTFVIPQNTLPSNILQSAVSTAGLSSVSGLEKQTKDSIIKSAVGQFPSMDTFSMAALLQYPSTPRHASSSYDLNLLTNPSVQPSSPGSQVGNTGEQDLNLFRDRILETPSPPHLTRSQSRSSELPKEGLLAQTGTAATSDIVDGKKQQQQQDAAEETSASQTVSILSPRPETPDYILEEMPRNLKLPTVNVNHSPMKVKVENTLSDIKKERSTSAEVTPEKQGGTEPSGGLEKETSPALFNFLERVATASTPPVQSRGLFSPPTRPRPSNRPSTSEPRALFPSTPDAIGLSSPSFTVPDQFLPTSGLISVRDGLVSRTDDTSSSQTWQTDSLQAESNTSSPERGVSPPAFPLALYKLEPPEEPTSSCSRSLTHSGCENQAVIQPILPQQSQVAARSSRQTQSRTLPSSLTSKLKNLPGIRIISSAEPGASESCRPEDTQQHRSSGDIFIIPKAGEPSSLDIVQLDLDPVQALEYRGQHASSSSNQLVQYSEFTMDSSQSVTQPRQHQHQQPHNLDDDIEILDPDPIVLSDNVDDYIYPPLESYSPTPRDSYAPPSEINPAQRHGSKNQA